MFQLNSSAGLARLSAAAAVVLVVFLVVNSNWNASSSEVLTARGGVENGHSSAEAPRVGSLTMSFTSRDVHTPHADERARMVQWLEVESSGAVPTGAVFEARVFARGALLWQGLMDACRYAIGTGNPAADGISYTCVPLDAPIKASFAVPVPLNALLAMGPNKAKYPDVPVFNFGDTDGVKAFLGDLWNVAYPGTEVGSLTRKDVITMTVAVLAALRTVPRPFAFVEAGALCGHSSALIATLMHRYCDDCELWIYDPRLWRPDDFFARVPDCAERGPPAHIERTAPEAYKKVHYFNDFSDELPLLNMPIGFAFLDGGKLRQYNVVVEALLEMQMPVGSIFAYHDAGKWISGNSFELRQSWLYQYAQAQEMQSTKRYEIIRQGLVENNDDEYMCVLRKRASATSPAQPSDFQVEVRLLNSNGDEIGRVVQALKV